MTRKTLEKNNHKQKGSKMIHRKGKPLFFPVKRPPFSQTIWRMMLAGVVVALAVLAEMDCAVTPKLYAAEPSEIRPNIIFILADDLGYGDLSCYGQKHFTTPRIDSLAAEGMRFTQYYAGSTVCAPSRCSLMTGFHTGHGFIRGNFGSPDRFGEYPLTADAITVADILHRTGYATGCFGKWGLGNSKNEGSPNRHGFDVFFGYYSQRDAHNYYPPYLHRNDEKILLEGKTYAHDLIVGEALEFMSAHRHEPFFCYMPVTIPHAAMQVPEDFMTPWRARFPEFEETIGTYTFDAQVRNPVAAFPAMMSKLDETVGRVLDALSEWGIDDQTIIFFSSDNGPHHEGGHRPDIFASGGPYRGLKRDLYEGGIRVPLLVRWPGKIPQKSVTPHSGAFWDFLPTVCDLIGTAPPPCDGISLLPTLLARSEEQPRHETLYWEFYEQGGKRALLEGDWKGVQLDVRARPNGSIELYNLADDPGEETDLAPIHPERVERFRQLFDAARTESTIFPFIPLSEPVVK